MSTNTYSKEHEEFLLKQKRKTRNIRIARYALLILFFVLWELLTRLHVMDAFIVSSPSRIIMTIGSLARQGSLLLHISTTLLETVIGFVLGTTLGTLFAIALWWFPSANRVLDPYLVVLNALPKIALGPILIVWLGAGMGAIVTMALLVSLIVTIISVLNGFLEVNGEKMLLMRSFGATKTQILRLVLLPASIPTIVSALKLNVGMSWVGVIVGEFLISRAGLGYLIVYGGQVFKLDLVMTSIVILCVLAAGMYYGVAYFEKRITRHNKA